jgi:hypothetical protein
MSSLTSIPHFSVKFLFWLNGFREEDLKVIFYQDMPNLHNLYKSAERKIPQKNLDYRVFFSQIIPFRNIMR